jgi:Sulfotransferase family
VSPADGATRAFNLLFASGRENNPIMRWIWSPRVRRTCDRDGKTGSLSGGEGQPDFICIGARKAGTSWLFHQLTVHPDFWMPPIKELRYFDALSRVERTNAPRCNDERDRLFLKELDQLSTRPCLDLAGYAKLFVLKGVLLSGDISPSYSMLKDDLVEEVIAHFPNLKVIFLARDPVERAWSQLSFAARLQTISPFDPADPDEVARCLLQPGFLLHSQLSKIVARWRRYVRHDLLRVFFFDDLERDPVGLRRSILRFLGADPDKPSGRLTADKKINVGKDKPSITPEVRSRLAHFFEGELKACATELGGPAKAWPARYGFPVAEFREHSKSFGPIHLRYEPNRTIESK